MAAEKTEALLVMDMKSNGKRALSTWVYSWIEVLDSANACRSRLPKPSNVEPL